MKSILLFATMLLTITAVAQPPTSRTKTPDVVWTWSAQCGGHRKLGLTVRLQRKVLYRGILQICRDGRDREGGRAEFQFVGGYVFQGENRTRPTDLVKGEIWQAGREPDALILGIVFDSKNQILLNALHIARPDRQTSSELDKGLFITTYPVPAR